MFAACLLKKCQHSLPIISICLVGCVYTFYAMSISIIHVSTAKTAQQGGGARHLTGS